MAPRKKIATAPMSALAARKARSQALAASSSRSGAASASAQVGAASAAQEDEQGDSSIVEVVLPLYTASQQAAPRVEAPSTAPSPSTRRRRSSAAQDLSSIATTRPGRSSSASGSARPNLMQATSTPSKPSQSTPTWNSAKKASSSTTTPASSGKKRKAALESDDDLNHAVQQILDELQFGESDDDEASTNSEEQPPRKKRASQPAKARTPAKSRRDAIAEADSSTTPKRTAAKRSSAAATPAHDKSAAKGSASEQPKRGRAAKSASTAKVKEDTPSKKKPALTADEKRLKAAQRYFAGHRSRHGKTHVGSSAMPVEDEATGFLAFGDDESDDESDQASVVGDADEHEAEQAQSDGEEDDSSEDDEPKAQEVADTSAKLRTSGRTKPSAAQKDYKRKGRTVGELRSPKVAIDDDEEDLEEAGAAPPALTREALLDAIPYSRFSPVLDGSQQNMVVSENKRKRGKEALYFGLHHGETLVFLGIGHVEVLCGHAQMGGAFISSSNKGFEAADIYAPISNPLPVLKSVPSSQLYPKSVLDGAKHGAQAARRNSAVEALLGRAFDTVIRLTPLASPLTALGQVCPIGGLATPFSPPPNLELSHVHQLSSIKVLLAPDVEDVSHKQRNVLANGTFATAGLSATYIPHKWQQALLPLSASALSAAQHPQEESVVALVRGNRKVGKSTLSRMALERLLSMGSTIGGKVAYLELDLGQSDFGPPGMVALHIFSIDESRSILSQQSQDEDGEGDRRMEPDSAADAPNHARRCITLGPGWCQPRVPARAHFIGDVSPRDDPESYVTAVYDLVEYFRTKVQPGPINQQGEQRRVPLIINTQGWIKGLGADLAARLEPMLRPTHIFEVIPRGSPDPVPAPTRGRPWLDADGAILGSGPEIITLESVSQLEFVQGAFGHRDSHHTPTLSKGTDAQSGPGDGGSTPPRYITDANSKLGPAESRLLNVMSYLYASQLAPAVPGPAPKTQGTWDFSEPLVHRRPLIIDVREGLKAGIRVLALGSSVPDSLKLMALNSSIVALLASDAPEDEEAAGAEDEDQTVSAWRRAFDRGSSSARPGFGLSTRCVGLGIVRSIDAESGHIHLLTPLDTAFLHEAQSTRGCSFGLVKGALDLPVWASLDFEAIKEARESRLDVPPAAHSTVAPSEVSTTESEEAVEQLLAGMPRNQLPYLEWPYAANALSRQKGKSAGANGHHTNGAPATPIQLGSEKRRVRRNLMRKSQFA